MSDLTFPRRRHSVFWILKKGEQGHNLILQSPVNVMLNNFKIRGWTPGSAYTQYSCMWTFHCLQNDILTWPRALLQLAKQHGIAVVDRIQSLIVKFQPKPPLLFVVFKNGLPLPTSLTRIQFHKAPITLTCTYIFYKFIGVMSYEFFVMRCSCIGDRVKNSL